MKIADYEYIVFFDTETTGFDAEKNRIIELAALRTGTGTDADATTDRFIRLPEGERIPEKIVEITHITDEMLSKEGRSEEDVIKEFASLMMAGKTLLIAHNAQFDLNFVARTMMRYRQQYPDWLKYFNGCGYIDTLTVFKDRRAYPHKLLNAIEAYGLTGKVQNSHRAIDDCIALYEVTKAMQEERDDLAQYINVFGFNPKYGVSGAKLKKVAYYSQPYRDYMAKPEQILPVIGMERR